MKRLSYFAILLTLILGFDGCAKIEPLPETAQPVIQGSSKTEIVMVGNEEITIGPEKDYEQDSYVIYRLTVNSTYKLSRFFVKTSSDVNSTLSHIVKTNPSEAIDADGNFVKQLNSVVVYFAYHIDPSVPVSVGNSSPVTVSFNFTNEKNYTGVTSYNFRVIKKESTKGTRLTIVDLPFSNRDKNGIGSQRGLNYYYGWRGISLTTRSGFFSLEYKMDIAKYEDVVRVGDKIDLVGYVAPLSSTATRVPFITANSWNFVSPSDTTVIGSKYAGSLVAQITLAGGAVTGGPHTLNLTVNGIKKPITYFGATTTTTATNFVTLNRAAFAAVGINLTSSANKLSFIAINDNVGFDLPTKIEVVSGTMTANDIYGALDPAAQPNNYTSYRDLIYRLAIREMAANLKSEGKSLRVVKFKRLDNIATADSVSLGYFDLLSHDNEFDLLLDDCAVNGKTVSGPVGLDQVWGFVMDNGRRGLIKTSPTQAPDDALWYGSSTASLVNVTAPNAGSYTLYCQIKMTEKK